MSLARPFLITGPLVLTLACTIAQALASTEVIQGYAYRGGICDVTNPADRSSTPTKNLTAGSISVSDLLTTDQASNATIGEALGFCVALRNGGPSQCQLTLQLGSGTVQACCGNQTTCDLVLSAAQP